jgi:HSP20 family protein
MTLVHWSPFRDIAALQNRVNRLFDEAFGPAGNTAGDTDTCAWKPPVDICETDDAFVIRAELPGVRREDISLEVKDSVLTLKGERPPSPGSGGENYHRRERRCGTFQRTFSLPASLDAAKTAAAFKDGILAIEIPKSDMEKPKQIEVKIG